MGQIEDFLTGVTPTPPPPPPPPPPRPPPTPAPSPRPTPRPPPPPKGGGGQPTTMPEIMFLYPPGSNVPVPQDIRDLAASFGYELTYRPETGVQAGGYYWEPITPSTSKPATYGKDQIWFNSETGRYELRAFNNLTGEYEYRGEPNAGDLADYFKRTGEYPTAPKVTDIVLRSETDPASGYVRDVYGSRDASGQEVIKGYSDYRKPLTAEPPGGYATRVDAANAADAANATELAKGSTTRYVPEQMSNGRWILSREEAGGITPYQQAQIDLQQANYDLDKLRFEEEQRQAGILPPITPYQLAQLDFQRAQLEEQIRQANLVPQITPYQQAQVDLQQANYDLDKLRFEEEQRQAGILPPITPYQQAVLDQQRAQLEETIRQANLVPQITPYQQTQVDLQQAEFAERYKPTPGIYNTYEEALANNPQGWEVQFDPQYGYFSEEPATVAAITPYQQAVLDQQKAEWEWQKQQAAGTSAYQQQVLAQNAAAAAQSAAFAEQQYAAEQRLKQQELEQRRQEYVAGVAARPQSWLEYSLLANQPAQVQNWMMPLLPTPARSQVQPGQTIPGWQEWAGQVQQQGQYGGQPRNLPAFMR